MRGMSITQPYASLIALGEKTIEVRSWRTNYRGELLICASARPKFDLRYPVGVTICVAELWDIREFMREDEILSRAKWERGLHSWMLRDVRPVAQVPIKGSLGLFSIPREIWEKI